MRCNYSPYAASLQALDRLRTAANLQVRSFSSALPTQTNTHLCRVSPVVTRCMGILARLLLVGPVDGWLASTLLFRVAQLQHTSKKRGMAGLSFLLLWPQSVHCRHSIADSTLCSARPPNPSLTQSLDLMLPPSSHTMQSVHNPQTGTAQAVTAACPAHSTQTHTRCCGTHTHTHTICTTSATVAQTPGRTCLPTS